MQTADSGESALELIAAQRPDVALFDVRLPGIDGLTTLQRALALHPGLVAVMLSAHSTVDIAVGAMKDGAVDFLVKPFERTQLDEVVARAITTATLRRSQARLLRLLENKTFRRVGGSIEQPVDVRVIAATNASLEDRVKEQRFRHDLFFRLNVIRGRVPPLRERLEDLPLLAAHFMAHYSHELGRPVPRGISPRALEAMRAYSWPGNVRELRNVIERALVLHPTGAQEDLRPEYLPPELLAAVSFSPAPSSLMSEPGGTLNDTERRLIVEAVDKARGNQSQAARLLGVTRDTLRYRLRKHGL